MYTQKTPVVLALLVGATFFVACGPTQHARYKHTKAKRAYFSDEMRFIDRLDTTSTLVHTTTGTLVDSIAVK